MALSRDERAERRRLNAILSDEEYGPKLVRLNKTEQRTILDLIEQNRGREARNSILRLTSERTELRREKRVAAKTRLAARVSDNVPPAGRNIEARVGGDYDTYIANARRALRQSDSVQPEYIPVIGASADVIRHNARLAALANQGYSVWFYH